MYLQHTVRQFDVDMNALATSVGTMAQDCERLLEIAVSGLWSSAGNARPDVATLAERIRREAKDVDARVVQLLALRQPAAGDLRTLLATFRLTTDLDRVAENARAMTEQPKLRIPEAGAARAELEALCTRARAMVHDAALAFELPNIEMAKEVIASDRDANQHYAGALAALATYVQDHPEESEGTLGAIRVARHLERIADHAKNIAEEAIFTVCGTDVRHRTTGHTG